MRALLDTSVFVAGEAGRELGDLSDVTEAEVSVVTLAELTLGVLMASEADRATRLATLTAVESAWDPLPISAEVARAFAGIAADLRHRRRKVPVMDALVAATALVEGIPIVTQDLDHSSMSGVSVIQV